MLLRWLGGLNVCTAWISLGKVGCFRKSAFPGFFI